MTVFAVKGQRHRGQQLADVRRRRGGDLMSEKAMKKYGVKPLARFAGFAAAGCRPRSWARPDQGDPEGFEGRREARGHRLDRAERGFAAQASP
jgi:hypothetical protein